MSAPVVQFPSPDPADDLLAALWHGYRFALSRWKQCPNFRTWRDLRRAYQAWKVAFTAESREGDGE